MELKGLSLKEIELKKKEGKVNKSKKVVYKTHLRIIYESFFSFFNIVLYFVALIFLLFQIFYPNAIVEIPLTKYGFLIIILCNGFISLINDERTKRIIEKMEILDNEDVKVIREGKIIEINSKEIVEGDYLLINKNESINVDGKLIYGEGYFNESVISGESKKVFHKVGEEVTSGSFLETSDNEYLIIEVSNVSENTFIKRLENSVKKIKKDKSKLNKDINKIILFMILIMIPCFLIVLIKELSIFNFTFDLSIVTACSTIIVGMIPTGLVLLSSITLANSIYKLSKQKVLTKELYAIERLARIDTLALDKTGTITSGDLVLQDVIFIKNDINEEDFDEFFSFFLSKMNDNITSLALKKRFNKTDFSKKYEINEIIQFDSSIKYSLMKIGEDIYKFGAPDVLISDSSILESVNEFSKEGKRVLTFIKNEEVIALFIIKNELRKNVKNIISYFNEMKIDIKVISGDNLFTVQSVAKEAGINGYEKAISLEDVKFEDLKEVALEYDIFARATPEQKEEIIRVLEENNHKVGYIGDGINDITSLRRATCSIALGSGVKSSKLISDFIVVDDDFSHLVNVIKEGRRVIYNVKRSSILFTSKDILIALFALYSLFSASGMVIEIESIYIFEFIIIALCGFLLSIENSNVEATDSFIFKESIIKGIENGLLLSFGGLYILLINAFYPLKNFNVLISLIISLTGPFILFNTISNYTKYSKIVIAIGIVLSIILLFSFPDIFLKSGYLSEADSLIDQLNLILKDFFNFNLYKEISLNEYIILLVYMLILPTSYIFLSKIVNKKLLKK